MYGGTCPNMGRIPAKMTVQHCSTKRLDDDAQDVHHPAPSVPVASRLGAAIELRGDPAGLYATAVFEVLAMTREELPGPMTRTTTQSG
jgi:hypothetical protein